MFKSVISIWSDNSIVDICKISLCASREESWRGFPRFTVKEQRGVQNKEIAKRNSVSFDSKDKISGLLLSWCEHDFVYACSFCLTEINSRLFIFFCNHLSGKTLDNNAILWPRTCLVRSSLYNFDFVRISTSFNHSLNRRLLFNIFSAYNTRVMILYFFFHTRGDRFDIIIRKRIRRFHERTKRKKLSTVTPCSLLNWCYFEDH